MSGAEESDEGRRHDLAYMDPEFMEEKPGGQKYLKALCRVSW